MIRLEHSTASTGISKCLYIKFSAHTIKMRILWKGAKKSSSVLWYHFEFVHQSSMLDSTLCTFSHIHPQLIGRGPKVIRLDYGAAWSEIVFSAQHTSQ